MLYAIQKIDSENGEYEAPDSLRLGKRREIRYYEAQTAKEAEQKMKKEHNDGWNHYLISHTFEPGDYLIRFPNNGKTVQDRIDNWDPLHNYYDVCCFKKLQNNGKFLLNRIECSGGKPYWFFQENSSVAPDYGCYTKMSDEMIIRWLKALLDSVGIGGKYLKTECLRFFGDPINMERLPKEAEANLVEYLLENRSDFEWSIDLEEEDEDEKEL